MKKKYKALICDVDGTLVGGGTHQPSKRLQDAVSLARAKIHIGVATARPLFLTKDIFSSLKLSGPSIIDGGAQIIDSETHSVLWEKQMNRDDYEKVVTVLNTLKIPFLINDDGVETESPKNYRPKKPFAMCTLELSPQQADMVVTNLQHIPTLGVNKFSWHIEDYEGVQVTHAMATKQHAIFEIAKILGITTEDIIGVGDSYNDFPLLMACGLKVAMGNAVPDLKAIADYIAPSVEDDGVADVIEKFVL